MAHTPNKRYIYIITMRRKRLLNSLLLLLYLELMNPAVCSGFAVNKSVVGHYYVRSSSSSRGRITGSGILQQHQLGRMAVLFTTKEPRDNNSDNNYSTTEQHEPSQRRRINQEEEEESHDEESGDERKGPVAQKVETAGKALLGGAFDVLEFGGLFVGLFFSAGLLLNLCGYGYQFTPRLQPPFVRIDTVENFRTEAQFNREAIRLMEENNVDVTTTTME